MIIIKLIIKRHIYLSIALTSFLLLILFSGPIKSQEPSAVNQSAVLAAEDVIVKRISKLEMYPCTDCHSTPADFNNNPRKMTEEHVEKKVHFDAEENGWCHRCHKEGNYIKLQHLTGKEISFNEAYKLCGECHGTQYNDWKKNIHGKRTGQWNGPKQVFSCTECHDPHEPAFKALKPKPPPVLPRGKSKSFLKLLFGDLIHEKK